MKKTWNVKSDETDFLPAALAVRDSPPAGLARIISYTVIGFFMAALAWSLIGQLEVIAVAHGKVIPVGHSKVIQSPEQGVIRSILVSEGDTVSRGDRLIILDDTVVQAELNRIKNESWLVEAMLERNRLLLRVIESTEISELPDIILPVEIPVALRERQSVLMQSQYRAYQNGLASKQATLQEAGFSLEALQVELQELEELMPITQQQADSARVLLEQNLASEHEFMQQEQTRIALQHKHKALIKKISALQMTVRRTRKEYEGFKQSFRNTLLTEKEKAETRFFELEQQGIKLQSSLKQMVITSPIDGRVERLSVHTEGGVVTAAQALMSIVPEGGALQIEAYLENGDVGFIREKQPVAVKVDAFPYTRFGILEGEVLSISSDAFNAKEQGWLFKTVISVPRPYLETQGKQFRLSPGMSAQVEIKTGKRKIIDYFLSPFQVKIDDSLTER